MVIGGMSHQDLKKLKESRAKKTARTRTKRTAVLSDKTREKALKKFDQEHEQANQEKDAVNIDEHVKMNDSYMRTGWYVPKKK
jgi:hypothetical protein